MFRIPSDAASLEHELEVFGCTHAEVGAMLMERWKLPVQLINGVRHHHDLQSAEGFERIAACVNLGNLVSHGQLRPQIYQGAEFKAGLELLELSHDNLNRWSERLRDHQGLLAGMNRLPV
jgi:HD-like signal output (HDOD) protein